MNQDDLKRKVAEAALVEIEEVLTPQDIIGVGTGSTVNYFIEALAGVSESFCATVSSSKTSTTLLQERAIPVMKTNDVERAVVYVDGADEVDGSCALIKGGGGALTQEKIVASISERFICIVDQSKIVERLGGFPLPIEVIPAAQTAVANAMSKLGGESRVRDGHTDNGNVILDVHGLSIDDPDEMEQEINNVAGVVTVGIFALHRPQLVLVADESGNVSRRYPN